MVAHVIQPLPPLRMLLGRPPLPDSPRPLAVNPLWHHRKGGASSIPGGEQGFNCLKLLQEVFDYIPHPLPHPLSSPLPYLYTPHPNSPTLVSYSIRY